MTAEQVTAWTQLGTLIGVLAWGAKAAYDAAKSKAAAKAADGKLDAIHTLNNGAARAGLERELDDAKAKLVMLNLIARLQKGPLDPDAQGLIEDTKKKIARLEKAIADHDRQTVIAEKHIDNAAPIPSPSLPSPKTLY